MGCDVGSLRTLQNAGGNLPKPENVRFACGENYAHLAWYLYDGILFYNLAYKYEEEGSEKLPSLCLEVSQAEESLPPTVYLSDAPFYRGFYYLPGTRYNEIIAQLKAVHKRLIVGTKPWWDIIEFPKGWKSFDRRVRLSTSEVIRLSSGRPVNFQGKTFPFSITSE